MNRNYTFNENAASKADGGGGVSEGGVYTGTLVKFKEVVFSSGASNGEITVKLDDGRLMEAKCFLYGKDGSPSSGYNKLNALMGMLRVNDPIHQPYQLEPGETKSDTVQLFEFAGLRNAPIRISVYRKDRTYQKDGSTHIGYDLQLLHFFDLSTGKTYTELKNDKPANTIDREIKDERIDPATLQQGGQSNGGFGGNSGGFGSSSNGGFGGQQSGGGFPANASQGFGGQNTAQQQAAHNDAKDGAFMNKLMGGGQQGGFGQQ